MLPEGFKSTCLSEESEKPDPSNDSPQLNSEAIFWVRAKESLGRFVVRKSHVTGRGQMHCREMYKVLHVLYPPKACRCPIQWTSRLNLMLKCLKISYWWRKTHLWFPAYKIGSGQLDIRQLITKAARSENTPSFSLKAILNVAGVFRSRDFRLEFSVGEGCVEEAGASSWVAETHAKTVVLPSSPPGFLLFHPWPFSYLCVDFSVIATSLGGSSPITLLQFSALCQCCPVIMIASSHWAFDLVVILRDNEVSASLDLFSHFSPQPPAQHWTSGL